MASVVDDLWRAVLDLAGRQHGLVARWQLVELGMTRRMVERRIASGRLFRVASGVFAVGRPSGLDRNGRMMAAVLSCGPGAVLSHLSAAALWGFIERDPTPVHVSVSGGRNPRHPGVITHRRRSLGANRITRHRGIPVTKPGYTFLDIACMLKPYQLERAVGDADAGRVISVGALRALVEQHLGEPGAGRLRRLLDRHTFRLTHTRLEQLFVGIVRRAGLPLPSTQVRRGPYRVDFIWPELGLVAETDGFTHHRTPAQQTEDARRDQFHLSEGRTPVRFSHAQIKFEPRDVGETLTKLISQLRARQVR